MITAAELPAELQEDHIRDPIPWQVRRRMEHHRAGLLVASHDTTHMCIQPEHANPREHRYDIATTPKD